MERPQASVGRYRPNELLSELVGDRLVAVTFVLDSYLQLQFDEALMNVDVWPHVHAENADWRSDDQGYGDVLRRLCGQVVVSTSERTGEGLRITLAAGEIFINPSIEEVYAEIALLRLEDGRWMCWRPGEESFEHLV